MFTLLDWNKTGQSTECATLPRYACVHALEGMKSLQCSCHDLAAVQISSTMRMRKRKQGQEREGGWVVKHLIQHELKLGWNQHHPVLCCLSQKDNKPGHCWQITQFYNLETLLGHSIIRDMCEAENRNTNWSFLRNVALKFYSKNHSKHHQSFSSPLHSI